MFWEHIAWGSCSAAELLAIHEALIAYMYVFHNTNMMIQTLSAGSDEPNVC